MKIAYVHSGAVPSQSANSVHVMKMCSALASEGADVTLFCPEAEIDGNPFDMYGVPQNFKIFYVSQSGSLNKIHKIRSICLALTMAKEVKKQGFDFVFGRSTFAIFFLRHYKPFIFESHMLYTNRISNFIIRKITRSNRFVNHIVITEELKQDYLSAYHFFSTDMMSVLQDAADIALPVTKDLIPNDESKLLAIEKHPVIGYLGHLLPGKCMEILSQVARKRPQYDFHIVGGRQEWVDKWKTDERCKGLTNIKFYGYVENKTIPYYYNNFDICVLPFSSQILIGNFKNANIARWTSPLKLFEAMSYGKAILTTNLSTIQEVLTDGENCLMESENNIDGWCVKLDKLVADKNLRDKLGESARSLFEKEYTWNIRAKKIIELFNKEN